MTDDLRWMRHALALGRRGMGQTWPNPAVGCVLVNGDRVVGRGWTQPGGRPHAEPQALAQAGPVARGATAYVTLEPCAHHGQTPPCTDALIAAGVARVVAPFDDKDPRVSGQGFERLRKAGIEVTTGVAVAEAARDHGGFFLRLTEGRPWLTLKLATSVDGRIATATGESQWITGPAARARVHALRARHDAVMVGAGTARDDDPSLTVRGFGPVRQPVRIVASRHLNVPREGVLARTARDIPVWLVHGAASDAALISAWERLGARCLQAETLGAQLSPVSLMQTLGANGLTRVFCEGGGAFAASLLAAGLVDELVTFQAGIALGAEGRPALGAMGIEALADAPRYALAEVEAIGPDTMSVWRRA